MSAIVAATVVALAVIGAALSPDHSERQSVSSAPVPTTTTVPRTTTTRPPSASERRSAAIAGGAVAECNDGTFSDNTDFSATCSSHDEVAHWLARYGKCRDGELIALSTHASCSGHDGFKRLMPSDFVPIADDEDVAKCKDGLFSDNTDFSATCSSHDGVQRWLARYGRCRDGDDILMSSHATCRGHRGFDRLLDSDHVPKAGPKDVAECNDTLFSDNTNFRDTCSSHDGVKRWLSTYARCVDGLEFRISQDSSCDEHGGFAGLLDPGYVPTTTTTVPPTTAPPPTAAPTTAPPTTTPYVPTQPVVSVPPGGGATALCNDGTYSYAAHHQGACSHHGGVAEWYK